MPNPIWTPGTPETVDASVIIDTNGNLQQCAVSGVTGTSAPQFGSTLGAITIDNTASWRCIAVLQPPAPLPPVLVGLPPPVFVNDADGLNPSLILADMIQAFQEETGRTLYPAQIERLLINLYAYRESVVRNLIQYAGEQSLLAFANFPNLDYLAQLLQITRLPAIGAAAEILFTLQAVQNQPVTLLAGTLVGSSDGAVTFTTDLDLTIAPGNLTGIVSATCTTPGTGGNGYLAGQINALLSPNPLIASAANTATSSGGADAEDDEALRARVQLAPNRFSTAGPGAAYKFFALGTDPAVVDVEVITPAPGDVQVFVLPGPIVVPANPAVDPFQIGSLRLPLWAPGLIYPAATNSFLIDSNNNIQLTTAGGTSGGSPPSWATTVGVTTPDGSVTWTCLGPLIPWRANTVFGNITPSIIIDTNGNLQLTQVVGISGQLAPAWNTVVGPSHITNDGTVVWTCLGSAGLLGQVYKTLSGRDVRPLTDTVIVSPPTPIFYNVIIRATLNPFGDPDGTYRAVLQAPIDFALYLASGFGRDIVPSEWISRVGCIGGVYDVELTEPSALTVMQPGQIALATSVVVTAATKPA